MVFTARSREGLKVILQVLNLTGAAAGGSDDWMKARAGVKYSYTVELPGGGEKGFDLPSQSIPYVCREMWEAVKLLGFYIVEEWR